MGWLTLKFEFEFTLGRTDSQDEEHEQADSQLDSMVETAGAPERPPLGFAPPSDPTRRGDGW